MKFSTVKLLAGTFALGLAIPAAAETAPKADQAATLAAQKHYTTTDSTIGELLDNPATKAVIDKYIPGLSDNPQISMAAAMTLRAIQPMAPDKVPADKLDAIDAELAKIPVK